MVAKKTVANKLSRACYHMLKEGHLILKSRGRLAKGLSGGEIER